MSSELFVNKILLPTLVWMLICLPLLGIILEASERMCRPRDRADAPSDDFEAFYLDLHAFATDVDFTREEAERLYRWEQRWMGEGHQVEKSQETL